MEVQVVFFSPFVTLSSEKQSMPKDHKDQSEAQSIENAVKIETNIIPHWVKI